MTQPRRRSSKLDDDGYPAYTVGLAADLLGVQPAFLRSLDAAIRIVGLERQLEAAHQRIAHLEAILVGGAS